MIQPNPEAAPGFAASGIHRLGWMAVLISLCFLLLSGCGRKASPVPPLQTPLPQATELGGRLEEGTATLTWRRPADARHLRGYTVMRAQSKASDPACPGCPLIFQEAGWIATDPDNDRFQFSEPVPEGFTHIYKVQPVGTTGTRGQDSNRVTIDHD